MSEQPPGEHSTRDPWPAGFDVPSRIESLHCKMICYGWDARIGYSRAYLEVKRRADQVGMPLVTSWELHHFVRVQARCGGREVHAMWRAPVVEGPLSWKFDSGLVQGKPSSLSEVRAEAFDVGLVSQP